MEERTSNLGQETTSVVVAEEMTLDEIQLAEQLYNNAGLDPIVEAGIKDYDRKIEQENKLINKVFGPRGSDIRGYSESVARRVSFAIYGLLNQQYGGKVGNMRSYIMSLEDERDNALRRYDDLMGRVIGILGEEYKELRSDSKEFMEKLTKTLGDDLKDSKIDQKALAERLADIDGLRSQIINLNKEKEQQKEKYETQTAKLNSEHKEEIRNLEAQIDDLHKEQMKLTEKYEAQSNQLNLDHKEEIRNLEAQIDDLHKEQTKLNEKHEAQSNQLNLEHKEEIRNLETQIDYLHKEQTKLNEKHEAQTAELNSEHKEEIRNLEAQIDNLDLIIKGLESDKTNLSNDLESLKTDYKEFKTTISALTEAIPSEEMGEKYGGDLYNFLRKDSKVPSAVLGGLDQFIDFKKYFGMAIEKGASEVCNRVEKILRTTRNE